jgi:hypothetical protein
VAVSPYRFVLSNRAGESFGEVQDATRRVVERSLKKPATAGFTIRGTNALVPELYAQDCLLRVYHYLPPLGQEKLVFHGIVTSLEAAVDERGPLIAATALDPAFYFTKRVVGKAAEWTSGFQGQLFNGVDKVSIAQQLINTGATDSWMMLDASTYVALSGNVAVKLIGPYIKLDEAINELANTADGFEWIVEPIEFIDGSTATGGFGTIGTWRSAPQFAIGVSRPNAAFEYGPNTRANIRDFTFQRSWLDMANDIYSTPQDFSTGSILNHVNYTSLATHGMYDDVIDSGEVTNDTLREQVANYHLALRSEPRNVVTFSPVVDPDERGQMTPLFDWDYFVGDTVPIKINTEEDKTLVSGGLRLWKMSVEIDQQDRVLYTPTTVQEA